ncbi:EamA family transporter, partial [Streptococcus uberis]|uniref:EamA family transporter n=1 Tax=Streptococcus uberis TaxID=1349 RepID=UPI0027DBB0F9
MNVKKQIFKGTLYAVVAGCMFGISGIFGQLFFRDYHGSPLWITSTRLTIAGIILLAISFFARTISVFFDVWKSKKNMPTLFFVYFWWGIFCS